MMFNFLMCLLGIILGILVLAILIVLGINFRIQQLKKEKYTDEERFSFVSSVASWAVPLIFRVKVEATGLEKLENVKTGALYPNHQSIIDVAVTAKAIKRPHGYVAKKELDNIFLISDAMRLIDCQFMDRNDVRQSVKVISAATKSVKEGHLMVIFPEGTRKIRGEMGTFKAGSFKISQKAKADIIPVTIDNSYEVSKRWPRRTVVKMEIHDPIPYEKYESLSTSEISEMVEGIVKKDLV